MTPEEYRRQNHDYIANFIGQTEHEEDDISGSVKATICQFLMNLKILLRTIGEDIGHVTTAELINAQIAELRRCIVDLQKALYYNKEDKQ